MICFVTRMTEMRIEYYLIAFLATILTLGMFGFQLWMRERRRDAEMKARELARADERETKRLELEEKRLESEESARYSEERARDEAADRATAQNSGAGSGGYIVIELPEKDRPMFHDLLKGFEDYAKLKGYHIAFSIDSSHEGRIAFKFTVKNDGFLVGQERVRQDFKEYIEQVRTKDIDELDKMPVITSIEEHNYLIAVLKNRLSFLQLNYKLAKTTATYYEGLIMGARSFPALPQASVIVQTGGNMDSRKYEAVNSQRLIQGDSNIYKDSSVNIGQTFKERQERIAALDDVIGKLAATGAKDESAQRAQRELSKVRDELVEYPEPDRSSIRKWLEYAKNSMTGAILGYEVLEAAKKLWELFGM
jgi:hypothetical protein